MENNTMNKVMAVLLALVVQAAFAQATWNGKADTRWYVKSAKEFTINTAEELAGFAKLVNEGKNFKGQAVKLGANITLNDTTNWRNWIKSPPTKTWLPIGSKDKPFLGTFDGNAKLVVGVYINSTSDYQGLFGYLGSGGKIKGLVIAFSNVKGKEHIGGFAGSNSEGEISFSYFGGIVTGTDYVGGFAGSNGGTIIVSSSEGVVSGNDFVGGFLGLNHSDSMAGYSHSTSVVIGEGTAAGGFAGANKGNIGHSYSTGKVTGDGIVGGFSGGNSGTVFNSYSSGAVTGKHIVGGFVGYNEDTIFSSYSIGVVTGKGGSTVGGLVGTNVGDGVIVHSYYNKQTSKQSDSGKGEGKTIVQLKQKATFIEWDFAEVWGIKSTVNDGYPYLLDYEDSL